MRKSQLFNALYIAAFPVFGYGSYYGVKNGLSKGFIVMVAPFLAILLLHVIDAAYNRRVGRSIKPLFWLCMAYIGTLVISQVVALKNGIPGVETGNVVFSSLVYAAPFLAAMVVCAHNRHDPEFDFANTLFLALSALLAINILGYFGGVSAVGHSFEGRANLPFLRGLYTGAHLLSIWALMLSVRIRHVAQRPVATALAVLGLLVALYFMLKVNSRLSTMIFLMLFVLFLTKAIKIAKGLYTISLFTLPLLLSFALLVYQVLSTPFFAAILGRVDKEDVTSFNGRSYIWYAVGDWITNDRRGLIFGLGYKGHYTLRLFDDVARLWGVPDSHNFHSHSTFAEVILAQGIVGIALLYVLFWKGFAHYRAEYLSRTNQAPIFAGLCYMLFIWQIDIFCYGTDLGHAIFFAMLAPMCIRSASERREMLK